jgi:hypothetical protein
MRRSRRCSTKQSDEETCAREVAPFGRVARHIGYWFLGSVTVRVCIYGSQCLSLGCTGFIVFMYINAMDRTIEELPMDDDDTRPGIHQLGFAGSNNPMSLDGQRAHEKHDEDDLHHINHIPESNVGEGVESLSIENLRNHTGHYLQQCMLGPSNRRASHSQSRL